MLLKVKTEGLRISETEKSGIGRRLLDPSSGFKQSNEHETQHFFSVNFHLISDIVSFK